jgi:hypothetical protein
VLGPRRPVRLREDALDAFQAALGLGEAFLALAWLSRLNSMVFSIFIFAPQLPHYRFSARVECAVVLESGLSQSPS